MTGEFKVPQKSQKAFFSQSSVLVRDYNNLLLIMKIMVTRYPDSRKTSSNRTSH